MRICKLFTVLLISLHSVTLSLQSKESLAQNEEVGFAKKIEQMKDEFWDLADLNSNDRSIKLLELKASIDNTWNLVVSNGLNLKALEYDNELLSSLFYYKALFESRLSRYDQPEIFEQILFFAKELELADCNLYYSAALYHFRRSERVSHDKNYKRPLEYLNKAINCDTDFPEAYWLKSQVLASEGGRVDEVIECWERIKSSQRGLRPEFYLFDDKVYTIISNAVNSSLKN